MKKANKPPIIFWVVIAAIVLGLFLSSIDWNPAIMPVENNIDDVNKNFNPNTDQFPNAVGLHWAHIPLIYEIYNCTDYQANRAIRAFVKIENETQGDVGFLRFDNSSEKVDIEIHCTPDYEYSLEPGYLVSGDSMYVPSSDNPNIIDKAYINFYAISKTTYTGGCTIYPDIEVHEILHGFGYDHSDSAKSIMYPSHVMCAFKIDDNIIADLKEKYGL